MATLSADKTHCPPPDQLAGLIHNDLSADRQAALAEHVGGCSGCQKRMDALACDGEPELSAVVRHIDADTPPKDSAFWKALSNAEQALTAAYPGEAAVPADVNLGFLQPSDTAGSLGRLGGFEIQRVIGRGGMGVVLRATDPWLSRDVAVKILDPQLANNQLAHQRFCREARAAAAVSHDNLVAVYQVDDDEASGVPFMVMQLVDGESLEQRLKRVGRLAPAEVARIGAQAAAGLAAAHAHGLIHRDIKPGNILIERGTDKVRLTDFGLARATEDLKLTKTGFVAGTPLYMAPEQARGDEVDHRADLFSLGSVLYEALAGKPPFDGKTPLAVLRRVADEAHPRLRRLNKGVPEWLEDVIDQLLAKEPGERFQTAAEVAEVLGAHVPPLGTHSPAQGTACGGPGSRLSPRMKRKLCYRTLSSLAVTFLVGTLLGGAAVWQFGPAGVPAAVATSAGQPADGGAVTANPKADPGPAPLAELPGKSGAVGAVAVSPDGSTLAMGVESGRVGIWDLAGKRLLYDLHPTGNDLAPAHRGTVMAADFTPDGKKLITVGDDGDINIWDLAKAGKLERSLPASPSLRAAAIAPTGNWVAVGDRQGKVRVFDIVTDAPRLEFQQETTVTALAFSADGMSVASGGTDGKIALWVIPDNGEGRRRTTLPGHTGPVYSLAFSPHGEQLASSGWDGKVIVQDLDSATTLHTLTPHSDGTWAVEFTPCGLMLVTTGQDGRVTMWDTANGKEVQSLTHHKGAVHTARFGKRGALLATGGRDGTVRVWPTDCK